jgi:hypothetical protein
MVQVDVFWSYGLGSSLAVAASRQLLAHRAKKRPLLESPHFTRALLFLSLVFAPSGLCLLWAFPSWETMHVGDKTMSALLVTGFAVTNVTQGILGFAVAYWLMVKRRFYLSYLQWYAAYFGMFFILVHGWDGTGYRRFFSSTRELFLAWQPSNVAAWFHSDVAITLYIMGVFMLPPLFSWTASWLRAGYALDEGRDRPRDRSALELVLLHLGVVFVGGLGSAILASLAIHWLGWAGGSAAFALVAWALLLRRGGLLHLFYRRMLGWREESPALAASDEPAPAPTRS